MFICLFVCQLQTATTTTTHDQLQAVPLFPNGSPPASPRLMSAAQLLSLIIKGNKLFSIDLHAASSTVQKPADTPAPAPATAWNWPWKQGMQRLLPRLFMLFSWCCWLTTHWEHLMCNNDLYLGEHKVVMLKFLGQPSAASSTPIINHKNVNLSFRLAHLQQRIAPAFSHAQPGSARLGSAQLSSNSGSSMGLQAGRTMIMRYAKRYFMPING